MLPLLIGSSQSKYMNRLAGQNDDPDHEVSQIGAMV
jgi:hypothetical protein